MSLLITVGSSGFFSFRRNTVTRVVLHFVLKLAHKTASLSGRGMSIWNTTDSQAYNKDIRKRSMKDAVSLLS